MRITFEFVGGKRDGKTVCSESADQKEAFEAKCFYLMTHRGEIGQRFIGLSDYAKGLLHTQSLVRFARSSAPEKYEVVTNMRGRGDVRVRCQNVPEKVK